MRRESRDTELLSRVMTSLDGAGSQTENCHTARHQSVVITEILLLSRWEFVCLEFLIL